MNSYINKYEYQLISNSSILNKDMELPAEFFGLYKNESLQLKLKPILFSKHLIISVSTDDASVGSWVK